MARQLSWVDETMARKKKTCKAPALGWVFLTLLVMLAALVPARAGVLEDVRNQFNKDKGSPRLVLLVSPT